ncbi:MAG TPA: peptide chain release factor N(5)-glutamine methyltransferase [Solirubrobacteraceae bacterium]|nr:peptide chain release factor N(5)-glutamine methyltransferase [Solirubrobacteraceae bacterium]
MTTLREEITGASASLEEVGCDSPRLDAELLLAHVLGVDRAQLIVRGNEQAGPDDRTRYLALLTRRAKREPIAYILGRKDFRHLTLLVDPRVLIPRPETELLVEAGLTLPQGVRVADIGTGSGAIALALKQERPDLDVVGVDVSSGALSVARMNAQRLGLSVGWREGDLLGDVECDAVLANLPYIADDELLAPEVALYEPRRALLGGEDGLDLVRRLIGQVAEQSSIKWIAFEVGHTQAEATAALVEEAGFGQVERLRDLAGHERVVLGTR